MTTKYTPGPWRFTYTSAAQAKKEAEAEGTDGGGASGTVTAPVGRYGKIIVFLPHHRDVAEDTEREANARLIAAATELAEALIAIFEGDTMKGKENYTHADVIQKHYQIARHALQKAGLVS